MAPNEAFQPLSPNGNGHQLPQLTGIYPADFSGLEEDKLDLGQIGAVARRRAFVIAGVGLAVTSGIVAKTMNQVPNYEGKFELLVGSTTKEDQLSELTESISKSAGIQVEDIDYETQIKVLWSPQVMSSVLEKIQTKYPEIDYDTLQEELKISRFKETKILEVSYQDSDPEKIQFVLEQIAEGYINYSEQEKFNSVTQGLTFVNEQTEKLRERVNSLQQELQQFRQQNQLIDPETQGQLLTNRASEIIKQRQQTQAQLQETQQLEIELNNKLSQLGLSPEQAIAASALSEATRYQQLLNQLSEIETKLANESARFTDENPTIQTLREQRENLLPLLNEEAVKVIPGSASNIPGDPESLASPSSLRLELTKQLVEATTQKQVLQARSQAVAQAESLVNQQLQQLPVVDRKYKDLQQRLQVATESLNRFLTVRETLEIEKARKTNSWQLIAGPQQPEEPISPNVPRGILLGAMAGVLAGAGAGLLAEKLDRVFHSADDIKDSTSLPVLGTIPFNKELKKRAMGKGKPQKATNASPSSQPSWLNRYNASPFLEAFRSLSANLNFVNPDQPVRSLVVSSAAPADGKSTTATFLAQAAAAMGQRVLLVDGDMRRPQVHQRTDLPNVWGLSNVISNEVKVDDVIQRSPIEDNLFVLTAGQIPPDPTRILSSRKMHNLVEYLQEDFDLVIFDAPPLLGLADARLLAAHTDGMVLVVGMGRTYRAVVTQVLSALKMSHARVLGVVANGIKNYTTSNHSYHYQYYAATT